MANPNKGWIEKVGCVISSQVAGLAAHPLAQVAVILVCVLWFAIGFATDILTAILSILAITLTQMVLNRQNEREMEDHRRDVAMHAKLDELIATSREARNAFVGAEDLDEEEIAQLKDEVKEVIEEAGPEAGGPREKETAKRAVEVAAEGLKQARGKARRHAPRKAGSKR